MKITKCIYCNKNSTEKLYVIAFEELSALFHLSCFLHANPDMKNDLEFYLKEKEKVDKKSKK